MRKKRICFFRFVERKIRKELSNYEFLFENIENGLEKTSILVEFEWFVRKAIKCKYRYYILSFITFVCPVISEVLICMPSEAYVIKVITGIILGGSSVAAALLVLLDVKNKWNIYRNEAENIKWILRKYNSEKDIHKKEDLMKELADSYSKTHEEWRRSFRERGEEKE